MVKLLDIGCGSGSISNYGYYLRLGGRYRITGVDLDENNVENMQKLYPEGEFRVASAEKLPFPGNTFDAFLLRHVLEHVKDLDRCLKEVARVGKEGAIVYVAVPSPIMETVADRLSSRHLRSGKNHLRVFSRESIIKLMAGNYLKLRKIRYEKWPLFIMTFVSMLMAKIVRSVNIRNQTGGLTVGGIDYRKSWVFLYRPTTWVMEVLNNLFPFMNEIIPFEIEVEAVLDKEA